MNFANLLVNCMLKTTCKDIEMLIKDLIWSIDLNTEYATTFYESGEASIVLDKETLDALKWCLDNDNATARKRRSEAKVIENEKVFKVKKVKNKMPYWPLARVPPPRKPRGVKLKPCSDDEDENKVEENSCAGKRKLSEVADGNRATKRPAQSRNIER